MIDFNLLGNTLTTQLSHNHISLPQEARDQLTNYLLLLEKWNQHFNLTSIRDPFSMIPFHIIDSLLIGPYLHNKRILDVGTGAGLPGIPLALAFPDREFTLIDGNNKKIAFLNHVILTLSLKNVTAIALRAELFKSAHCFDSIVCRALTSLNTFVGYTHTLLCKGGKFLAMKGQYPFEEIEKLPGGVCLESVKTLILEGFPVERHLVILQKTGDLKKRMSD